MTMFKCSKLVLSLFLAISLFAVSHPQKAEADTLTDLTAWYTAMDGSKGWVDLFTDDISYLLGHSQVDRRQRG